MSDLFRAMVQPHYVEWPNDGRKKHPLAGCVLAFGAGQLVHERGIFDFERVEQLIAYDPFEQLDINALPDELKGKVRYFHNWDDVLKQEIVYDEVLCLFSLHYEPQWLRLLCEILNGLKSGGALYFCEDCGFRAVLDGKPNHDFEGIHDAFRQRLTTEVAAPWAPDISASDASLMREILELFGDTKTLAKYPMQRVVIAETEPQCYLPWNEARTGVDTNLIAQVRKSIAPIVQEEVQLYRFKKASGATPINLFDLDNPKSSMIWRALSDRAGRAVGSLIVSSVSGEPTAGDFAFRKAALAVLYQNVLRHFSFWRAAELVVGALNPEIKRVSDSDKYKFTCVIPNENPRFWGVRNERPEFLAEYAERLKLQKLGWVGESIYREGRGGVYCWPGVGGALTDDGQWQVITDQHQFYKDFVIRETPACVYIIDPLATLDPLLVSKDNQLLFGAVIIYLGEPPSIETAEQLRCLLFVLETSRSIVVGRAGFLEMELMREHVKHSTAIQEPLKLLQDQQENLRVIHDAVQQLRSRLERNFMSPGLAFLDRIRETLEANLFDGNFHDPWDETPERLIPVVQSDAFRGDQQKLLADLRDHGARPDLMNQLFEPFSMDWMFNQSEYSLTFAKTLSRRGRMPLSWLSTAMTGSFTKAQCAAYIALPTASGVNPIGVTFAMENLRRIAGPGHACGGPAAKPLQELDLAALRGITSLRCTWAIAPNYASEAGLQELADLFWADKPTGNTSSTLFYLKQALSKPVCEVKDGLLAVGGDLQIKCYPQLRTPRPQAT